MAYGVCKLTGKSGEFIKSHLLPRALTSLGVAGERRISGGQGSRPKRSWTSWYDEELVVKEGEEILADYDNWAIAELRRLELVWSGWLRLETPEWFDPKLKGFGLRMVECANPEKLRLFFLSLLWRAAASTLPEFGEINLEQDELECLRTMVREGNPRPFDFYPVNLLQIVQNELPHNLGPFATDISFRLFRRSDRSYVSQVGFRIQADRKAHGRIFVNLSGTNSDPRTLLSVSQCKTAYCGGYATLVGDHR
jgi:hypothetical protein